MGKICEFYSGKNVLITGATGFCGTVLVEKLLRSCGSIGKIYILVRRKKNASPQERYSEYVKHFIFDDVRKANEGSLQKIIPVSGDITIDGLELSQEDESSLINSVSIIFHCAANVKFNDPLEEAININATGTLRVLQLAEKMTQLKSFLYMSTSFCQSYQEHLEERYYPTNLDVFDIIEKTQKMNDIELNQFEKNILNNTKHPNTYTLSKALAEDIIYSYHKKIPIAVMRPSLVWFAVEEPFKGYISGMHSGIGIICGGMTGFIRSMYVGNESEAKLTPVDYTVNATIVAAWNRSLVSSDELLVYNCTDSKENPFLWKQGAVVAKKPFYDFAPYEKLFWYPKISYTSSYAWHMISMILFQLFPAILYDLVRLLSGGKPMFTRLQLKIINGKSVFYYFTTRNFRFETEKLQQLFKDLNEEDQSKFYFNHATINWTEYYYNGGRQVRKLLLKEDEATIPKAQRKFMKFYYANLALKASGMFLVLYCGVKVSCKFMDLW